MNKRTVQELHFYKENDRRTIPLLVILFIAVFFISFAIGRYPVDPLTLVKVLLSRLFPVEKTWNTQVETVVFNIRLPRVLIGAFIGAGLSLSGLVYQGIFQNPMVSPDVLGSTSGAGFGSALALLWGLGYIPIFSMSFIFGLLAVFLVLLMSRFVRGQKVLTLVLGGIMISSLFNAALSFVKLVADTDDVLPQITYYLIGSLTSTRTVDLAACAIVVTVSSVVLFLIRWQLNVMTLSDEEAVSLGVDTKTIRLIAIVFATLMTAVCTASAGMIGWVGLVIPHLVRMTNGCDYRKTIPDPDRHPDKFHRKPLLSLPHHQGGQADMRLDISGLTFSYDGKRKILDDISLSFHEGEFVAILGRNGAGKTTFFKNLLGLLKCQEGRMSIDGAELGGLSVRERAKRLAYIPQSTSTVFSYSVLTSVLMGTTNNISTLSTPSEAQYRRARLAMEKFGIAALAGRTVDSLSGGERQLVLCARAIAQQADVLIFDEPTSNLDWGNQIRTLSTIRGLVGEGYLALVSTHNVEQALNYASRLVLLDGGRIVADGSPGELASSSILGEFYDLEVDISRINGHYVCIPKGEGNVVD